MLATKAGGALGEVVVINSLFFLAAYSFVCLDIASLLSICNVRTINSLDTLAPTVDYNSVHLIIPQLSLILGSLCCL